MEYFPPICQCPSISPRAGQVESKPPPSPCHKYVLQECITSFSLLLLELPQEKAIIIARILGGDSEGRIFDSGLNEGVSVIRHYANSRHRALGVL